MLALLATAVLLVVPTAAAMAIDARISAGAREIAAILQAQRWEAVAANETRGLYFVRDARGWQWFDVRDGNGNGLRTAEVRAGVDPTVRGPFRLEQRVAGIRLGFPPTARLPAVPPRTGSLANVVDPVQFGRSDLISFSALGTSSSGTLYVTDGRHALRAIVLFGPSARLRVWRLDTRENRWKL